MWVGIIQSTGALRTERGMKAEFALSACGRTSIFSYPWTSALRIFGFPTWTGTCTIGSPGPQALMFGLELCCLLSWAPRLQMAFHGASQPS